MVDHLDGVHSNIHTFTEYRTDVAEPVPLPSLP